MVNAGDVLFALPATGELIAFKPRGEDYQELARKYKVAERDAYCYPVISGKADLHQRQR